MKLKTLLSRTHLLTQSSAQLSLLNESTERLKSLPRFSQKLSECDSFPLKTAQIEILQVNIGKLCNQTCKHCHVDAGPDRKEIMTRETMQHCIDVVRQYHIPTVDITGGAPELNPHFRWFVENLSALRCQILDRCNLTIILANKNFQDLPHFFAKHKVQVISSLPYYQRSFTDRQRGDGVFDKSISALRMLNDVGYAKEGTGLELNLVYNPAGAFLSAKQEQLEQDFKRELKKLYNIDFNHLYCITNMPISRFLEYLLESGNVEDYMEKLVKSFNPTTLNHLMCRRTLSVSWDGKLYDCDFNQMLDLTVASEVQHIKNFSLEKLHSRFIRINQHCYGCTAGGGSSCGGSIA